GFDTVRWLIYIIYMEDYSHDIGADIMDATTIRIDRDTHRQIKDLAAERGCSILQVVRELVKRERQERMLQETNEAYAALREDEHAWAQEQQERAAWDATLGDGLDEQ
ncbi:MAG: hypothetical protein ACLFWB_13990, partial [Armatimonadota bacterium]